jgi:ribosome-associated protein
MPPAEEHQPADASLMALAPGATVAPSSLRFSFTSSSGPGGQNVNKRATRAQLRVTLGEIHMPADARARLRRLAGSLLTDEGVLVLTADEYRSQKRNKDACIDRLRELVARAMVRPVPRKKTKPSRGAVQRRIDAKKQRGETKRRRSKPSD